MTGSGSGRDGEVFNRLSLQLLHVTEDENRKQKIKDIRDSIEVSESYDRKKVVEAVGAVFIGFLFTAFLLFSGPDLDTADADQRPDIEGEWVQLNLTEFEPVPLRPTIQPEDGVKFHNSANHTFQVSFDRNISNVTLESGETAYVDIDSITYYRADPIDEEERLVKGSIYVDG